MAVTLKEIAKIVNLSPSAVSLVLNNRPNRISKEKRDLILKTANELNYVPNQNAVGLVKQQSKTIGVMIPDIKNVFFSEIVSGIDKIALERGWNIIIMNTNDRCESDLKNIRMLISRSVDAMILVVASNLGHQALSQYQMLFLKFGKPVIFVDRSIPSLNNSSVSVNHKNGAYTAIKHLYDLGHRKIAILSGPVHSSVDRTHGVMCACRDLDLHLTCDDFYGGDFTMDSGYKLADAIAARGYTAIFSFNDMMVYGLYKRFAEIGLCIPDDISVIGFDDIFFSNYINLTTVRQPAFDLGVEAARQAFLEIENPEAEKKNIVFEPSLQIRTSVKAL